MVQEFSINNDNLLRVKNLLSSKKLLRLFETYRREVERLFPTTGAALFLLKDKKNSLFLRFHYQGLKRERQFSRFKTIIPENLASKLIHVTRARELSRLAFDNFQFIFPSRFNEFKKEKNIEALLVPINQEVGVVLYYKDSLLDFDNPQFLALYEALQMRGSELVKKKKPRRIRRESYLLSMYRSFSVIKSETGFEQVLEQHLHVFPFFLLLRTSGNDLRILRSKIPLPVQQAIQALGTKKNRIYFSLEESSNPLVKSLSARQIYRYRQTEVFLRSTGLHKISEEYNIPLDSLYTSLSDKEHYFYIASIGERFVCCMAVPKRHARNRMVYDFFRTARHHDLQQKQLKEYQSLKATEEKNQTLSETSWAIGHKLMNLINQLRNAHQARSPLTSDLIQDLQGEISSLLDHTQSRHVPPRVIEINRFLRSQISLFFYNQKNTLVRFQGDKKNPHILIRTAVLRDMLNNLLSNAIKHGKAAKISIETKLFWSNNSGKPFVEIRIKDDGRGVPTEVLTRGLGKKGNTSHPEGSGMGLYQVIEDCKGNGGSLKYDRIDSYSHFVLSLPVYEPKQRNRQEALNKKEKESACVLIIDDEEKNLDLFRNVFVKWGIKKNQVYTASQYDEALSTYLTHREKLNMVICDIYLQGMEGTTVFSAIRNIDSDLPFCFYSGSYLTEEIQKLIELNAQNVFFFQKGVDDLAVLEDHFYMAVREKPFNSIYRKVSVKELSDHPQKQFARALLHRIHNLLMYPLGSSEIAILSDEDPDKSSEHRKQLAGFFTNLLILMELSEVENMSALILNYFRLFNSEPLAQKNSYNEWKYEQLRDRFHYYFDECDTKNLINLKDLLDHSIENIMLRRSQNVSDTLNQGNPIHLLFRDSQGRMEHILNQSREDKSLEEKYKDVIRTVLIPVSPPSSYFNEKGEPEYEKIFNFCQRLKKQCLETEQRYLHD